MADTVKSITYNGEPVKTVLYNGVVVFGTDKIESTVKATATMTAENNGGRVIVTVTLDKTIEELGVNSITFDVIVYYDSSDSSHLDITISSGTTGSNAVLIGPFSMYQTSAFAYISVDYTGSGTVDTTIDVSYGAISVTETTEKTVNNITFG